MSGMYKKIRKRSGRMSNKQIPNQARYKKKILALAVTTALLALVYLLALFFDPERVASRSASFTWFPPADRDVADRIEISRPNEGAIVMMKREGSWFAQAGTEQVPVKQGRIDDLFRILGTRGTFPYRGSSSSSHSGFGLTSEKAIRLVVKGGASAEPLLDLLIGDDDASGKEVYLRKNGQDEYRSGDPLVRSYVAGENAAWYDLKLFKESMADYVQRIRISPLKDGEGDEDYTLAINDTGTWVFEGSAETPSPDTVHTYTRNLFDTQGDDFLPRTEALGIGFNAAKISVELGDGSEITITAGEEINGKRPVTASGSSYIYLVSQPAAQRLVGIRSSFLN
jgi:hypothetical protein